MTYLGYPIPGTPCGRMHMAPTGPVPVDGRARIGTCSLCGGDVLGHVGAFWSVLHLDPASETYVVPPYVVVDYGPMAYQRWLATLDVPGDTVAP